MVPRSGHDAIAGAGGRAQESLRFTLAVRNPRRHEPLRLIESAKLVGLEPAAYLRETILRALQKPGAITLSRDLLAD